MSDLIQPYESIFVHAASHGSEFVNVTLKACSNGCVNCGQGVASCERCASDRMLEDGGIACRCKQGTYAMSNGPCKPIAARARADAVVAAAAATTPSTSPSHSQASSMSAAASATPFSSPSPASISPSAASISPSPASISPSPASISPSPSGSLTPSTTSSETRSISSTVSLTRSTTRSASYSGTRSRSPALLPLLTPSPPTSLALGLGVGLGGLFVVAIILSVVLWFRRRLCKCCYDESRSSKGFSIQNEEPLKVKEVFRVSRHQEGVSNTDVSGAGSRVASYGAWRLPLSDVNVDIEDGGLLGCGALGEVRRATWQSTDVAVKRLRFMGSGSLFERECEIYSRLRHPNIVEFLGVVVDKNETPIYIAMELMDSTLGALIHDGTLLPLPRTVAILTDVACALEYIHEQGVIHRDLKSANVLLSRGGRAKLADLGHAKFVAAPGGGATLQGLHGVGTFSYQAPELRIAGEEHSPMVDMFSFGVLVAEVAAAKAPSPTAELLSGEGNSVVVVPELDRRTADLAAVPDAALRGLAERCLANSPTARCPAREAVILLRGISR